MARIIEKDYIKHRALADKLDELGYNGRVTLQSVLNESDERKIMNVVEKAISTVAEVIDYQHDGQAAFNTRGLPDFQKAVEEKLAVCPVEIAVKPTPTFDVLLALLRKRFPDADWDTVDSGWENVENDRMEAVRRHQRGETGYDLLLASLVPTFHHEGMIVRDSVKFASGGQSMEILFWDKGQSRWEPLPEKAGKAKLTLIARACLKESVCRPGEDVPLWGQKGHTMRSVVDNLSDNLFDREFAEKMDSPSTWQWLMFKNGLAMHRDTKQVQRLTADVVITRCCSIDFPRYSSLKVGC